MNSVLFIDIDTVLSVGTRHYEYGSDDRITLAEQLGDHIADATYSWDMSPFMLDGQDFKGVNVGMGTSLSRIRNRIPKVHPLTVVALTRTKTSLDDMQEVLAAIVGYYFDDSLAIDEVVHFAGDVSVAVEEYLDRHASLDIKDYAVLTRGQQWYRFQDHYIQSWGLDGGMSHNTELMTVRLLLDHAPWYEWENRAHIEDPWDRGDPYGSDRYDKVILLDIDGVLNDEGPGQRNGVYVDSRMVDNLAHIVEKTSASIVLTSSWKHAYQQFAQNGFKTERKHLLMLQEELDRCGLRIDGMTPSTALSGSRARPFEIMEWLRRYWQVNAYVVLEDDTFWEWGWLRNNVVTTQTPLGVDAYGRPIAEKGLTEKHAHRAISILDGMRH